MASLNMAPSEVQVVLVLLLLLLMFNKVISDCKYEITNAKGVTGVVTSENYPKPYPASIECMYIFQGTLDERINITFLDFDLKPGITAGCLYDYVEVVFVTINNVLEYDNRFCGPNVPAPIISVHQRVQLKFKSTRGGDFRGFKLHYGFIDQMWHPFPESDSRCGKTYITGVGGVLTSPGFPEPYPNPIECTWMIRVADDMKITMNFLILNMGESVLCKKTYIDIFNGFASPEIEPDETLCGQLYFIKTKIKEFKGTTFRVVIRFKVDEPNKNGDSGFKLSWTAVKLPKQYFTSQGIQTEKCPEFHCQGGMLCIDESQRLCNALQKYCIADSLRCNGISNCGAYDPSDEAGCVAKIALIATGVIVFVVVTVAIIVVHIKRKQNKHQNQDQIKAETVAQMRRESTSNVDHMSYHHGVNNVYTSVPRNDVQLRQFDKSPSSRRYTEHTEARGNGTYVRNGHSHQQGMVATPAVMYGVTTESCCSDTEQDYLSSCSNYGSPASLRYHHKPVVYKIVQPADHRSSHSISATV